MIGPGRIAIVSGYFNPLHVGHLDMMEAARARADALVVIVNNDDQQVMKKGKVITDEAVRLRIVEALRVTDSALIAVDADGSVAASLEVIHAAYPGVELEFCNGGDRSSAGDVPSAETHLTDEIGLQMVYGVGGEDKADSSSRINEELSRSDSPTA